MPDPSVAVSRRSFLTGTVAAGLGAASLGVAVGANAREEPGIRRYARLGRTNLEISDVSFGGSRLRSDPDLVRHVLERGINYLDTAESYTGGNSEETIGAALGKRREEVVLVSKVHSSANDRKEVLMRRLEASLERLRTDRIDIYMNHAVNDPARLQNGEWFEFTARAKQQGKIRFTGMSGHGGKLIPCLDYAIDNDLVDVLLVAYNFGQDPAFYERFTRSFDFVARQPDLPRVLKKARAKDVGIVAMKTLMGARLNDMRPYETGGSTFAQAAFRWVLSGGLADALVVTMRNPAQVDEYVAASGSGEPTASDLRLLRRYADAQTDKQCRYGCDACSSACPDGVSIAEILRTRMYERDYGDRAFAKAEYRGVLPNASVCTGCAHRSCAAACPYGLPLSELLPDTHLRLG